MVYPDVAYTAAMKVILFFVNSTVTFLTYYWGANLVLSIYQKNVAIKQKLLFSLVSSILLNIVVAYFIPSIRDYYKIKYISILYDQLFAYLSRVMLPFAYFVLYWLGIKVLDLSSQKSIKIMQLSYVYYVCCSIILKISRAFLFPNLYDPKGYNYLRDIYMFLCGAMLTYVFYRVMRFAIQKYKLHIDFPENIIIKNISVELSKNFFICCIIYAFVVISYTNPRLDGYHSVLLFILFLCYLVFNIAIDYRIIYLRKMMNLNEHIIILTQHIQEYRGIKRDFNTILQTYSVYLAKQEYKTLKDYHKKVVGNTILAVSRVDISKRMIENPSFFSLIVNKLDKASEEGLHFHINLQCKMDDTYIDELDFNRIMAILLDNAIEAAEQTSSKQISLSCQTKADGSKLLILSNDTIEDSNIEHFFLPGFTTKDGHMGQGLPQVRSILQKYGNCTFNVTLYRGSFSVYFELKPVR